VRVDLTGDPASGRALLATERHGVLSTAHAGFEGWPFGSGVPFATTAEGDPVVLLAEIAEHAKNLAADPRACLFVADSAARERPQSGARLALLCRDGAPGGAAAREAQAAYFARFPEARGHLAAHGFALHVLRVERVRWIAGFGSMGWWPREAWAAAGEADPLAPHAPAILAHLNGDHADALLALARRHGAPEAERAAATALDAGGLSLEAFPAGRADPARVRVPFPAPAATPDAVRRTVIALVAAARR
jgi:putative heme iron utilization protein